MAVDMVKLAKLTEVFGVPGYENEISALLVSEFKKLGYDVSIDQMGNVIASSVKKGKEKRPLVMLSAHMDEIGLLVKYITEKGFLRFMKVGGIDNRTLLNQRVVVETDKGKIYGVIGSKPPHMLKPEEVKITVEVKNMFIDIGAKDKKEVEKAGVKIGDAVSFDMSFKRLVGDRITGKALDDRVGCYVMLEVARRLKDRADIVFVGSVQEEISTFGKGAQVSAWALEPDVFIALDTSIAGDHPEMSEEEGVVVLGKGAALAIVEAGGRGNMADKKLVKKIVDVANKNKIPFQMEAIEGGSTDAAHVHNMRGGVPSLAICVPTRYIHSNVAVCALEDIDSTIELVVKAIQAGLV